MSERRFTDKPDLDPASVWALDPGHPAMVENRTLFPSTVVTVTADEPDRLLVSGANNRKLGKTVEKGRFKGYALYGLSLEERATCPADCEMRAACYGNGMQFARRHRIGDRDVFFDRLASEIVELLDERDGLLIRLHVLGDSPDVEYVAFWKEVLDEHTEVACYGYTHWTPDSEVGSAIQSVKDAHPDRFRIRWSGSEEQADGAVVVHHTPRKFGPRIEQGLVCPAQTDATACCATCGLCWEPASRNDCIAFIKHGRMSDETAAASITKAPERTTEISQISHVQDVSSPPVENMRAVCGIDMPARAEPATVDPSPPETRLVSPTSLFVEPAYQRDLSGKSIKLIRKIVTGWEWSKFKPPVVADQGGKLFVIDGQHTAIAAATHPGIEKIPVFVVPVDQVEKRADSFVSHNRERINMTPFQVFHAEAAAKDKQAMEVLKIVVECGASIPRSQPAKGRAGVGTIVCVGEVRRAYRKQGPDVLRRVLRIAVAAKHAPITRTAVRGLSILLTEPFFERAARMSDDQLAGALEALPDIDFSARVAAEEAGTTHSRMAAQMIAAKAGVMAEAT